MNNKNHKRNKKVTILKGIKKAITEVRDAKSNKDNLQTLESFLLTELNQE